MNTPLLEMITNFTFDELTVGQHSRLVRTLTMDDIQAFAAVSGDTNPTHLDQTFFGGNVNGVVAHGMWGGAVISALLGTQFPGPGTVYVGQNLTFLKPIFVGDVVVVTGTITAKEPNTSRVHIACQIMNQHGDLVLQGTAIVIAPTKKMSVPRTIGPRIQLFDPEARFNELLSRSRGMEAVRCGIVHPCDKESFMGAMDSFRRGLIIPILIGPERKIRSVADECHVDLSNIEIIHELHSTAAAEKAATLAVTGHLEVLMKGSLHTDELLHAVLAQSKLRTGRRMSHIFRFDIPLYAKQLLITDAALNIKPTLHEKVDIIQNAIDFARILGVDRPKVAILSAVEVVNPNIPSTIDAAALCKMADRGQIRHGILDGPLAFDNAISLEAARIKQIESPVSGDADIMAVPDLESGNMLAKQLEYLAGASGAGLVLGARVPIALTSRADGPLNRVASALLAQLAAHDIRRNK